MEKKLYIEKENYEVGMASFISLITVCFVLLGVFVYVKGIRIGEPYYAWVYGGGLVLIGYLINVAILSYIAKTTERIYVKEEIVKEEKK
jgi:hypothetical protein